MLLYIAGIESQVWAAGQAANPNPRKYLPTVVTGFGDLKKRALCEGYECGLHRSYLDKVANDMVELNKKHANSVARINELKQKLAQLYHRVLQVSTNHPNSFCQIL